MSNANYNKQTAVGYGSGKGAGPKPKDRGAYGAEHGPSQKDNPKAWPKPGPNWGTSFNRTAKFPVVKTRVVKDGVD